MTADETTPNFPDCVPTLLGDGIVLRAHSRADAHRIVEQSRDRLAQRFVPLPRDYDLDAAYGFLSEFVEKGWTQGKRFEFAIDDVSGSAPVFCGNMGIWPCGSDRWEIGWIVHPDARGRGIGTRAAQRILQWVFEEKQAKVVKWMADSQNAGSAGIARKLGFSEPVIIPSWLPLDDQLRDCAIATLTKENWESQLNTAL